MSDNILRQSWSRINIDVDSTECQATISLLNNDLHRKLIFTLTKGGEKVQIPAGYMAMFFVPSTAGSQPEPYFEACEVGTDAIVTQLAFNSPDTEGVFEAELIVISPAYEGWSWPVRVAVRAGTVPPAVTNRSGFDAVRDLICFFGKDAQAILNLVGQVSEDANALEAELPGLETKVNSFTYVDAYIKTLDEDLAEEVETRKEWDEKARVFIVDQMDKITPIVSNAIGNLELLEGDEVDAVATVNAIPGIVEDVPELVESSRDDEWIGAYCFYNATLPQSMDIHHEIKHIGDYAFAGCRSCAVTLPEGLKTIGAYAFAGCDQGGLTIPASVQYIGDHALDLGSEGSRVVLVFESEAPLLPCPVIDPTHLYCIFVPEPCVNAYRQAWPDLAGLISPK